MARNPVTLFTPGAVMAGADPFLSLHREMNRLFDEALHGGTVASGSPAGARSSLMLAPHIDVTETGKDVRIQVQGTSPGGSQQGDPQQAGGGGEAAGTQASQQNGSTPASGGAGTPA